MQAIILLAGQSKRFWPLKEKPLFPICGKTLLEHQLDRLAAAGFDDVLLVGGAHNLEEIRLRFPDLATVEQEDLALGMRGALLSALPQCGDGPVLIVSGNDVFDANAYRELEAAASKTDGAILAQQVTTYFPGGYLTVENNRVTGIVEKPGEGSEPSDLVNIVAHIHNDPAALLSALQEVKTKKDDGYEQAVASLLSAKNYTAVPYKGLWQAVKYPWHLLDLLPLLLAEIQESQIDPSVDIHETAVIQGNVVIEAGTRVMPHATIVGPCYIGKNCIIANNSLVRGSSIGDDSIVGYCTEAKASVWHSHVWTHMCYSGDSVIGHNVSFGAGTVTGNMRLDEGVILSAVGDEKIESHRTKFGNIIGNGCRLGIHVTLDPGVKLGADTFVSSATHISSDVPDAQFVRIKEGKTILSDNRVKAPAPTERDQYRRAI